MSDTEDRSSDTDTSPDEDDILTEGLVAKRGKRATAGNLYATLRANLDDEDLQKDLLAEDEEDAGEYEGSEREDDDEAMESSGDEDDAGPTKEGDNEDLEGEKELKKVERAEARRKRKLEQAKMRVPAWQKKRVKLADDVKTEDGAPVRTKKKSERSNWLPTGIDAPMRQSHRSLAITNREIVHANLKQSAARSEKQRRLMKHAAERENAKKRADLTQEQRLLKVVKIERETDKEFGRWEREEAERQRIRDEQMAAKRKRGDLTGAVIRHWSGSVMWAGDKIKIRRMHNDNKNKNEMHEPEETETNGMLTNTTNTSTQVGVDGPHANPPTSNSTSEPSGPSAGADIHAQQLELAVADGTPQLKLEGRSSDHQVPWLEGIQAYAAQSEAVPAAQDHSQIDTGLVYLPSAPILHGAPLLSGHSREQTHSQVYHGWTPGVMQFSLPPTATLPPPPPPAPLVHEQAQRSLIMLERFKNLDATPGHSTTSRKFITSKSTAAKETGAANNIEPTPVGSAILPDSYPSFNTDDGRYLSTKMKKHKSEFVLPLVPGKPKCALTSWPARYRDPKTGLPYADQQTYKMIQRLLSGGCAWSPCLGAWVGPWYGDAGRPARGVPEGFAKRAEVVVETSKMQAEDAKMGDA